MTTRCPRCGGALVPDIDGLLCINCGRPVNIPKPATEPPRDASAREVRLPRPPLAEEPAAQPGDQTFACGHPVTPANLCEGRHFACRWCRGLAGRLRGRQRESATR